MKIGDKVKLIGIPPDAHDGEELQTRTLFEKCLGRIFTVAGLKTVEGLPYQLVQLNVGHVLGEAPSLEKIWIEPEYLPSAIRQNRPIEITSKPANERPGR